jgi:hypothetical protein
MSRAKVFISILMVLILLALSVASVWAAPGAQGETISGVVTNIVIEDDTVLVTLDDSQTVRLSLETAVALGLVVEGVDDQGNPTFEVNQQMIDDGETVDINPDDVMEDGEEGQHPVALALVAAEVFADLGLDYDMIMGRHEDGMGFGVIAKACWLSIAMKGDASLLGDILDAKKGLIEFSSITLPDGSTASNWGQFKKAVMGSDKAKQNLGAIMSGRAKQEQEQEQNMGATANQGKDKKGKGPGEDGPPGQSKDKDKGGGPPAVPPGQEKDKDKGGGKGKDK